MVPANCVRNWEKVQVIQVRGTARGASLGQGCEEDQVKRAMPGLAFTESPEEAKESF